MNFYAQTMPGIEKIAWLEMKTKLSGGQFHEFLFAKGQNGLVRFGFAGPAAELLGLRTVEDVFAEVLSLPKMSRDWKDLRQIADRVANTAVFDQALNVHKGLQKKKRRLVTYRVISRKYGRHQYRRKDIGEAVAKGIERRYPKWRLVADQAQVEIWVNMLGSELLCGIRLSDRTMRHRFGDRKELPAALRPSVAAALVYLTQPAPDDVFLDPMCGSGTILMERRLVCPYQQMIAADSGPEQVAATRHNLLQQKKTPPPALAVLQSDVGQLPLAAASISKIATNLPFGKQIGSPQMIARLYPKLFQELERILEPSGRAIVLSSEFEQVKTAVRHCPTLKILTGYSVAILGQWGRIYIIERST